MLARRMPQDSVSELTSDPIIAAHRHSSHHRDELARSTSCGCFYCLRSFSPAAITEWTDEVAGVGQTAICPRCGIDSVIGNASGYSLDRAFLERMHAHWF
jgi:hypothetical protein